MVTHCVAELDSGCRPSSTAAGCSNSSSIHKSGRLTGRLPLGIDGLAEHDSMVCLGPWSRLCALCLARCEHGGTATSTGTVMVLCRDAVVCWCRGKRSDGTVTATYVVVGDSLLST